MSENKESSQKKNAARMRKGVILIALLLMVLAFSVLSKNFFTLSNIEVIFRQVAILVVLSFGMTFVISTGGIDLSIGSTVALVGVLTAFSIKAGFGVLPSSLVGILTGTVIGLANGIIIAKVNIPPFLVTLGMMSIVRGFAMVITQTFPVPLLSKRFGKVWSNGMAGPVPTIVLWAVLLLIITQILYCNTPFGNYVKAVGGNETAAKYAGVNVDQIKISVYALNGLIAGIAGCMMVARMNTARCDVGADLSMDAITATVLGGTSMFGGKGSIIFTGVGALILTVLSNGLVMMGVDSNIQTILKGIIVILAVSFGEKE